MPRSGESQARPRRPSRLRSRPILTRRLRSQPLDC